MNKKSLGKMRISGIPERVKLSFNEATKAAEQELENKIELMNINIDRLNDELSQLPFDSYEKQNEVCADISDAKFEIHIIEEQLISLLEMKVVNLYKIFEITVKALIVTAYPEQDPKSFFAFENVKNFFKSKNIEFTGLNGFLHINQIRIVNNCIKHSDNINEEVLKKVPTFKEQEAFTVSKLDEFYTLVSVTVKPYLKLLAQEINKELYEFSEDRLENLAQIYSENLSDDELNLFIEKLSHVVANKKTKASSNEVLKSLAQYAR